jgi:pyridoxine 5'-phosphate synthase PdxJ
MKNPFQKIKHLTKSHYNIEMLPNNEFELKANLVKEGEEQPENITISYEGSPKAAIMALVKIGFRVDFKRLKNKI